MKAQEAFNTLDPNTWAQTPIHERLHLLERVQANMREYADELAAADGDMKNKRIGDDLYFRGFNLFGTIGPIGNAVAASIELYESLAHGKMPEARNTTKVNDDIYDVQVFPRTAKEKLLAGKQHGHVRVKGKPSQVSPLDKPPGIIAVLGAGNYSSSLEMVKALFWENKAVIHKPHHLNEESDKVWQKIFAPLVEIGALSFCDANQGRILTTLDGLTAIYFTGGTATAQAIMKATDTPLVSECGGNNPCIVVPGDRPWTDEELEHQALKFVSMAKMNGGAVCGRAQTLVTSKQWSQRDVFLDAIRAAIAHTIPGGTYYPGSDEIKKEFLDAYPNAEILQTKDGAHKSADMVFIPDAGEDGYAAKNEAFCQIIGEVALDVPATVDTFLPAAVAFSNEKLLGTLGCMVLIDDDTREAHKQIFDQAITDLSYGGIAVNTIPPMVFFNPYLTWGGNEEGREFVSGNGNFGNVLNFEHVEKSILYDQFVSPGDLLTTNVESTNKLSVANMEYVMHPTWIQLMKLMGVAMGEKLHHRDN